MIRPLEQLAGGWRRFWFTPEATSTLALFRIAFGLLATAWTLAFIPNLFDFFTPAGIEPGRPKVYPGEWGVLPSPASATVVATVFLFLLLGCLALTVGWYTRIAAVVVWLGVLSVENANTLVGNSGDGLIRNLAFFLIFAPSGVALSVDRWRKHRETFWAFPERAPWALRLVQIQISVGYLSAVWHKVQSELWREGTAVSYALRIEDIARFPAPGFVTRSPVLIEAMTFGTLALELSLGILIWNRVARPWVMTLGVTMHLAIDYAILIGFFSLAMYVSYLSFLRPETASRLILAARDRVRNRPSAVLRRSRAAPRPAAEPATGSQPAAEPAPTSEPAVPERPVG
jgi:putative effector of murein hydrolase LrgA (UPF0299 family)